MSSPMKPWEGAGANSRVATPPCCSTQSTPYGNRPSNFRGGPTNETGQIGNVNPPPVPNRPQRSSYGTAGGYNGGMTGGYGKKITTLLTVKRLRNSISPCMLE